MSAHHASGSDSRRTRRRFLRDAGAVTGAAALGLAGAEDAFAPSRSRQRGRRQTVAVFGGGIAGLTAAHELAERGFEVTVYESVAWGGRVRGAGVPRSSSGRRQLLPGEHSFHAYFGTYLNLADTMRRIPFGSNPTGTFGNLVVLPQAAFAQAGKKDLIVPLGVREGRRYSPAQFQTVLISLLQQADLPPQAAAYFASRIQVYLSSCDARRSGELERIAWTDFIGADRYNNDTYRELLAELPQFLFASKPERTSAKFISWILTIFLLYNILGFGNNGAAIRVLNGPVDETWINPWLAELRRLGVALHLHRELTGFEMRGGRVVGARVQTPGGRRVVSTDWYVSALPVNRARRLWSRSILAADPGLARMHRLSVANSNGIQYYLRENAPIIKGGYQTLGMPWAPTFINQAQFWAGDFASTYGHGTERDVLSVAMANWDRPGIVYGKVVRDCTQEEFAHEVWEQIKRVVNKPGEAPRLTDDMLVSWHLDDAMVRHGGKFTNEVPLVIPTVATEQHRPDVATAIPNLMLCGDYVKGVWEIATMEAANFSGRRAANAVLERAGSRETRATTTGPYRPPEWEPFQRADEDRYAHGQPNVFDVG